MVRSTYYDQSIGHPPLAAKPYVVVIFGRTGVGISSLVNLIVGRPVSDNNPDAKTASRKIKPHSFEHRNKQLYLYEVPGFGGRFPKKAILETIRQIERDKGIDLFIYCLRKQKATVLNDIVRPIRTSVCEQRIPMIAVVTELELFGAEGEMDTWWDASLENGLTNGRQVERECFGDYDRFDAHACVTTLPPVAVGHSPSLLKRREWSEERIRRMILQHCAGHKRSGRQLGPISRCLSALLNWIRT